MGTVITFPAERCSARHGASGGEDATVIILPVVRIERYDDAPSGGLEPAASAASRRKRRKR